MGLQCHMVVLGFPSSSAGKESTCNSGDPSSIPGSGGTLCLDFTGGSDSKKSACNVGELGLFPGLGRSPGGGHGNPLQYSCLKNPMDRGAGHVTVHSVTKRHD